MFYPYIMCFKGYSHGVSYDLIFSLITINLMCLFLYLSTIMMRVIFPLLTEVSDFVSFFFHEMDSAYYSILCNKEKLYIVHLIFKLAAIVDTNIAV